MEGLTGGKVYRDAKQKRRLKFQNIIGIYKKPIKLIWMLEFKKKRLGILVSHNYTDKFKYKKEKKLPCTALPVFFELHVFITFIS